MGNWKKHYSTEHLDASDIPDGKQATLTITAIGDIELDGEGGKKERKALITFTPEPRWQSCTKRTWAAAKTCGYCLAAMFGDDDAQWIGKRVTVHAEKVSAFGEWVDAVRVYGSPDIKAPIEIRVKSGRKKQIIKLHATKVPDAVQAG